MLRIDRKLSVTLSYVFCVLGLLGIVAIGAVLVFETRLLSNTQDYAFFAEQSRHGIWTYLLEYFILSLVLLSDILLMRLLGNVRKERIFTDSSVQLLRCISWAALLAGCAAIPLSILLNLFSVTCIAFVGFFLGIVLRVVKNVIEEGTAIKEENDSTI